MWGHCDGSNVVDIKGKKNSSDSVEEDSGSVINLAGAG